MKWKIRRRKRFDDDPRPYVSKNMSTDEFAKLYDMTFQHREKFQPEAFTFDFWEKHGSVVFTLEKGYLTNNILDVGCGSGEIDIIFGMKGYNVCGLDISQYAIKIAKRQLKKQSQISGEVSFINGNIEEIDLTDRFNTAIIFHTLEHVINPHRTLEQTIRFLNPGAKILVEVPYKKSYRDRTDLRHFSPRKLRKLLSTFSNSVEVIHFKERRTIYAIANV